MRTAAVVAVTALMVAALPLHAQTLRGTVTDAQGQPVTGALVFLQDSATATIASNRALTTDRGAYFVTATRAGIYRLRAQRIGFRPVLTAAYHLQAGQTVTAPLVLEGAQVALDTVRVATKSVCRVLARDTAAATFAVWDQARLALASTLVTTSARAITAQTIDYQRTLDREGRRVLNEAFVVQSQTVRQPWRTPSVDSLHRFGYVGGDADSTAYSAPGIEVLLSDQFLADHCFHLAASPDTTLIGLAFAPTSARRNVPEIAGTLWLARQTSELRALEFGYVNIPRRQAQVAGGEVQFLRLRNGSWVIAGWNIRMPALEQRPAMTGKYPAELLVREVHVTGGQLALATDARSRGRDTLWAHPPLVFAGMVVDSLTGTPVPGATVALQGTALSTTTDSAGHFALAGALPGEYTVEIRSTWHDALGATNQSVAMLTEESKPVTIRIASAQQIAQALCRSARSSAVDLSKGILLGRVEASEATTSLANATVSVWWTDIRVREASRSIWVERPQHTLETHADSSGAFRVCGVPMNTELRIRASTTTVSTATVPVRIAEADRFANVRLVLDPQVALTASLVGRIIVDSTTTGIADAEIAVDSNRFVTRSAADGSFRLDGIPPGTHDVQVRRIGYLPLTAHLAFSANETEDRTVYLHRVTVLDSVRVEENVALRSFEEHRRVGLGRFLTREDLAKKEFVSMAAVIHDFSGVQIITGRGSHSWVARSRGPQSLSGSERRGNKEDHDFYGAPFACYAEVWLDGTHVYAGRPGEPLFNINSIRADQIEAIEYYAGPSSTPSQYSTLNATCGVLVIWRRQYR